MFVYFRILRRVAVLPRHELRRTIAVATSPVLAIVLGVLYALPDQSSRGWIAVVGAALLFGVVVAFPTPSRLDIHTPPAEACELDV